MVASYPQAMKRLGALLLLLLALPLGGCWDTVEVNDRGIVSSVGFDRDEDGQYSMWAAVLEPIQFKGESVPVPVRLLHGRGRSFEDAMVDMQGHYIPRIYLGHLQWIMVSERLAREGLREMYAWLQRSLDIRLAQSMVVAEGSLVDLLSTAAPQAMRSLSVVLDTMAPKSGGSANLGPWMEDLMVDGRDPIAGSFRAYYKQGRQVRKDEYDFRGIVLFRNDRMVGKLPPKDSVPFLLLNGDLLAGYSAQSVLHVNGVERAAITWLKSPVQRKSKLVNGKVQYEVTFTLRGRLSELQGKLRPYEEKDVKRIEDLLAAQIAVEMQAVFAKLQAAQVDSVGVGQLLHAKYPAYWAKVKHDWNEVGLPKVKLVIHPKVVMEIRGLTRGYGQEVRDNEEPFGAKPKR